MAARCTLSNLLLCILSNYTERARAFHVCDCAPACSMHVYRMDGWLARWMGWMMLLGNEKNYIIPFVETRRRRQHTRHLSERHQRQ